MINQEKSALQREIERLSSLLLNQSTTVTAHDEVPHRRSPTSGDIDGDSTPRIEVLAEPNALKTHGLFRLDLTKIGPTENQDQLDFIHETPDKKRE